MKDNNAITARMGRMSGKMMRREGRPVCRAVHQRQFIDLARNRVEITFHQPGIRAQGAADVNDYQSAQAVKAEPQAGDDLTELL